MKIHIEDSIPPNTVLLVGARPHEICFANVEDFFTAWARRCAVITNAEGEAQYGK